jgi:hypothetical protein
VRFMKNILRHTGAGFNITGRDGVYRAAARRILIQDNIFEDIDPSWGNWGDFAMLGSYLEYVTFNHNTIFHKRVIVFFSGDPVTGFVYKNNISAHGLGLAGNGRGSGIPALNVFAPGFIVQKNVMAGGSSHIYPSTNYFPASLNEVLFTNISSSNYLEAVINSSPLLGTDGKALGADIAAVTVATANAVQTP